MQGWVHPLHRSEREGKKREGERGREREIERERKRVERERESREYLFLKGMTGDFGPFSYLVNIIITHAD